MSRWFRFYDDTINHPKALKLSDRSFRIWVGMLCLASKNNGILPSFEDMCLLLRVKPARLQPELEILIAAELLDHDDSGIAPHDWNGRQYKSDVTDPTNAERQKRYRNGKRNGPVTVDQTVLKRPDTESDTEAEKEDAADAADPRSSLFKSGLETLARITGKTPNSCRSIVGKWLKSVNDEAIHVLGAIEEAERNRVADPVAWINRVLQPRSQDGKSQSAVIAAADKLVAGNVSFGPKPSLMPAASGSGAGAIAVRMLPEGRCERPGDVHGGDYSDPGGIPGGGRSARHGPENGDSAEVELPSDRG